MQLQVQIRPKNSNVRLVHEFALSIRGDFCKWSCYNLTIFHVLHWVGSVVSEARQRAAVEIGCNSQCCSKAQVEQIAEFAAAARSKSCLFNQALLYLGSHLRVYTSRASPKIYTKRSITHLSIQFTQWKVVWGENWPHFQIQGKAMPLFLMFAILASYSELWAKFEMDLVGRKMCFCHSSSNFNLWRTFYFYFSSLNYLFMCFKLHCTCWASWSNTFNFAISDCDEWCLLVSCTWGCGRMSASPSGAAAFVHPIDLRFLSAGLGLECW
jgi:hypothetical protein